MARAMRHIEVSSARVFGVRRLGGFGGRERTGPLRALQDKGVPAEAEPEGQAEELAEQGEKRAGEDVEEDADELQDGFERQRARLDSGGRQATADGGEKALDCDNQNTMRRNNWVRRFSNSVPSPKNWKNRFYEAGRGLSRKLLGTADNSTKTIISEPDQEPIFNLFSTVGK
jgi:hypothetical protein